jgi:membrane protein
VLGFIYKKATITQQLFDQVAGVIGRSATTQLQSILTNMSRQNNSTLLGVIGILVFIFGATGIFSEIQSSINYIWSIKAKPKRSWLKYLRDRLVSLLLVIGMGFVMLITLLTNLLIDIIADHLPRLGAANMLLLKGANFGLLFVVVTFVFVIIFKVLPDARIRWGDALIGALFTSLLFLIGKFLISYYLHFARSFNAYGAATSVILVLTWVYYSAMILYFGAEFTEAYARKYGGGVIVNKNAVHILKQESVVNTPPQPPAHSHRHGTQRQS